MPRPLTVVESCPGAAGGLPSPTPTATRRPTPVAQESALVVDSASGQVFGSADVQGVARLSVFDSTDGHPSRAVSIGNGEVLLGLGPRRRLYLYHPDRGVRFLDADSLEPAGRLPLPTPHPSSSLPNGFAIFPVPPFRPLVDPRNGHVWTFDRLRASEWDPSTGQAVRVYDRRCHPSPGRSTRPR